LYNIFIKNKKFTVILLLNITLLFSSSCRMPDSFGFYQPITLGLDVPDGPKEYQAGWHSGCSSAMGSRLFANSFVYQDKKRGANMVNGIYHHDKDFQAGWSHGWFSCNLHTGTFVFNNSMRHGPLQ
jgi:hypothetical protein